MKEIIPSPVIYLAGSCFAILFMLVFNQCEPTSKDYIHDYYPLVYDGDLAFFKKDYPSSYEALKKAVQMKRPPNFEPYRELEKLANVSAILEKKEEAIRYIERLIDRGYELQVFQQDTTYAPVWQHSEWKALVAAYPKKRATYLSGVNFALRQKIIEMNERDQRYRSRPDRFDFRKQQLQLDSLNTAQLKNIFETQGYPNPDLIGYIPPDSTEQLNIINILMRTPEQMRLDYFIPKLRSFVESGQCPPKTLALVTDQYHLRQNGYQIYGTMMGPNGLLKINDPGQLEQRRQDIGLPTMRKEIQRDSAIRMLFYLDKLVD